MSAWLRLEASGCHAWILSTRSPLDVPCECENPDRNSYLYRKDKRWHCEQCDGLMNVDQDGEDSNDGLNKGRNNP